MRVLGVDPGLTRCGIGVVDELPARKVELVAVGVVRTPPDQDHAHRLLAIEAGIEEWVRSYRPDAMAVERVFAQHNLESVLGTAQAMGVAMLVAARHEIPITAHTPSEVKAAITGSGTADKAQVGAMVARILSLAEAPKPADAADAVALAICHLWRGQATNKLSELAAEQRSRVGGATAARTVRRQEDRYRQAAEAARQRQVERIEQARLARATRRNP